MKIERPKNRFLAFCFGPLFIFERSLVLLGILTCIPYAIAVGFGVLYPQADDTILTIALIVFQIALVYPEKWEHLLPEEFTEPSDISRTMSVIIGLVILHLIFAPVIWRMIKLYLETIAMMNSMEY